jgi:hypothetical protein
MSLTPPKRLFHVPTMSTVFYENVVDDVKKKGYAAISHVWGEQTMYSVDELGVKCGIDWDIPLSDLEKMDKLKESMSHYEMEYCWFDVFCMPQNKIHEVNAEVPFMGDYYAGAAITLVISKKSGSVLSNGWKTEEVDTDFTKPQGIASLTSSVIRSTLNANVDDDEWFTRVWTFQEAVLSKNTKYIGSRGVYHDLSASFDMLDARNLVGNMVNTTRISNTSIVGDAMKCHREGKMDLIGVMSRHAHRNCYKPQDKFYGALGVLDYKDFVVDYNIEMDDLNKKIIQHAYSRGDMSWLSAGTLPEYGFIQPLYNAFDCVGKEWFEEIPGICNIKLQSNALQINTYTVGTVTQCTHWTKSDGDNFVTWAVEEFRDWKLKDDIIVRTLAAGQHVPESSFISIGMQIYNPIRAIKRCGGNPFKILPNVGTGEMSSLGEWLDAKRTMFEENASTRQSIAMISYATGEQKPLVIHGHPDVGDTIMLLRMHDKFGRVLGIVVDKHFRRKGICLCEKIEMTKEEAISRFSSQEFPL